MKVPKILIAFLVLAGFLLWWILSIDKHDDWLHCNIKLTLERFEEDSKARNIYSHTLKLDSLTEFDWDSLIYFSNPIDSDDGTFSNAEISKEIGIKITGRTICDYCDRLIFIKNGEVVSFVDLDSKDNKDPRIRIKGGEESGATVNSNIFLKKDATFIVYESCKKGNYGGFVFLPVNKLEQFKTDLENSCYK
ncbi:hypothetical protein [Rufibacter immobilis]|uniref:hypothetical protein n=1 Tax=Rufibacter immobilis TaxID=1348778 RepID=UPI0035E7CAF1